MIGNDLPGFSNPTGTWWGGAVPDGSDRSDMMHLPQGCGIGNDLPGLLKDWVTHGLDWKLCQISLGAFTTSMGPGRAAPDGTVVLISTALASQIWLSRDCGQRFESKILPGASQELQNVATDGNGKWFINCSGSSTATVYYYSLDNGNSWTQTTAPGGGGFMYGSGYVHGWWYLGYFSSAAAYRTQDLAKGPWLNSSITPVNNARRFTPLDDDIVIVNGEGAGMSISYDNGVTWVSRGQVGLPFNSATPLWVHGKRLWQCVYDGTNRTNSLFYSDDYAATWQPVRALPVNTNWIGMAYSNGVYVCSAVNGATQILSADGITWQLAPANKQFVSGTYHFVIPTPRGFVATTPGAAAPEVAILN